MKHQHRKNLGAMAAALFVCAATAGCDTPVEEPTDAEYELLMRSWDETDRVVSFLEAIVPKVDEEVLVDRLGEEADEDSFMESVYVAQDVSRDIIEEDRLYVYNSENASIGMISDSTAFYGKRVDGDIIAWNRDALYLPDGSLIPYVDSSIFLHEGAHAFREHDSSVDDVSDQADTEAHVEAVVETRDFAYEITYLATAIDKALAHFETVGSFWDNLTDETSEEDIERRYQRLMERLNSRTIEDFLVTLNKDSYELLGVTDEEIVEAFEESGLWEELRNETRESLEIGYREWRPQREREVIPESEMGRKGARR